MDQYALIADDQASYHSAIILAASIKRSWRLYDCHSTAKDRTVHRKTTIMKLLILVALTCCIATTLAKPGSTYTDKWDHINVDEILQSDRLLKGYVDCLLENGRCTPDGKELKTTLPDALEHNCSKCTKKQKESADRVIKFLVNQRPEMWKKLSAKYDPENIYQERYKDKIQAVKQ